MLTMSICKSLAYLMLIVSIRYASDLLRTTRYAGYLGVRCIAEASGSLLELASMIFLLTFDLPA